MFSARNMSLEGITIIRPGLVIQTTINSGTFTVANDTLYMSPLLVTRPTTVDALQYALTATLGAGSVIRVGLYDSDPANSLPRNVLWESAPQAATSAATFTVTMPTRTLAPGVYYIGFVAHNCSAFAGVVGGQNNPLMPTTTVSAGATRVGFSIALTSAQAMPNNPSTSTTYGFTGPRVGARMA